MKRSESHSITTERKSTMKKTFVSIGLAWLLVIVLASVTYAAPAAKRQVPFMGALHAVESQRVEFPTLFANGSGSGNATHLGRFTFSYEVVVDLRTFSGPASAHFVAANGDIVFAEGSGQSYATETSDVRRVVETYTITGGTGRFADASGSFTVERLVNRTTGSTAGLFYGNILMP
jgi:hypothetical protein